MPVSDPILRAALAHTLDRTDLDSLGAKYEGKVRDNYSTAEGGASSSSPIASARSIACSARSASRGRS